VLVVDGANVVGSRPNGWWRDRAGAARRLHEQLSGAGAGSDPTSSPAGSESGPAEAGLAEAVILVLEGAARAGQPPGSVRRVRTVHAEGSGDDAVVDQVRRCASEAVPCEVVVVTADRGLRARVEEAGATTRPPSWLLARIRPGGAVRPA